MSLENLTPEEIAKLRGLLGEGKNDAEVSAEPKATTEHKAAQAPRGPRKPWFKNKVILTIVAFGATVALAATYVFFIEPAVTLNNAKNELSQEVTKSAVTVGNSEIVSYTPENEDDILAGANPKQIALGKDGKATPPAYIEFRSENSTAASHVMDLYIDFFSQRSRDLISLNYQTLQNFISSGKLILRVHPVVDSAGFSIYAPEALAEVAGTHPDLAWDFFVGLMRNSDAVLNNPNTEEAKEASSKEIVEFIAGVAADAKVPTGSPNGVDADSIKYLSFFSWLYSGGRDEKLKVGYYPPVVYIDDEEVDQDKWILTNPDSVLELLTTLK